MLSCSFVHLLIQTFSLSLSLPLSLSLSHIFLKFTPAKQQSYKNISFAQVEVSMLSRTWRWLFILIYCFNTQQKTEPVFRTMSVVEDTGKYSPRRLWRKIGICPSSSRRFFKTAMEKKVRKLLLQLSNDIESNPGPTEEDNVSLKSMF